jgi:tetratricopeptide (TPR) repeat protein
MRPNNEILIDYLDQILSGEELAQAESLIANSRELASDLEFLKLAVNAVRLESVNEKVSDIRRLIRTQKDSGAKLTSPIVRTMYKPLMRIAAILVLVLGLSSLYKYVTVSDQSIYNKQFAGYILTNARGSADVDPQAEAYQNKNWPEVISLFNKEANKTNKSYFLAGISEMQLNQFPNAIRCFENILHLNANSNNKSFEEDAEYYVSLAYLMNHEEEKAVNMLNKIKADRNHLYFPIASQLSIIDLKIIELKR